MAKFTAKERRVTASSGYSAKEERAFKRGVVIGKSQCCDSCKGRKKGGRK